MTAATTDDFTVTNTDLIEIPYSTVRKAIEATGSDPFKMLIRCPIEWTAIAQCVNRGIDSHLEAICDAADVFDNSGRCEVTLHSLCVLLRRLGDTDFTNTAQHSAEDIWNAATSLQSSILLVLGTDEYGKYVGREEHGLE